MIYKRLITFYNNYRYIYLMLLGSSLYLFFQNSATPGTFIWGLFFYITTFFILYFSFSHLSYSYLSLITKNKLNFRLMEKKALLYAAPMFLIFALKPLFSFLYISLFLTFIVFAVFWIVKMSRFLKIRYKLSFFHFFLSIVVPGLIISGGGMLILINLISLF